MGTLRATGGKSIDDTLFWMCDDISAQNYLSVNKSTMKTGGLAKGLAILFNAHNDDL